MDIRAPSLLPVNLGTPQNYLYCYAYSISTTGAGVVASDLAIQPDGGLPVQLQGPSPSRGKPWISDFDGSGGHKSIYWTTKLAADLSRATKALEAVGADLRGGVSLRGGRGRAAGVPAGAAAAAPSTPSFAASTVVAPSSSARAQSVVQVLPISAEAVRSAQRAAAEAAGVGGVNSGASPSHALPSSPSHFQLTGSDVAAAALEEEAVSQMAAKFLGRRQQQQQVDVGGGDPVFAGVAPVLFSSAAAASSATAAAAAAELRDDGGDDGGLGRVVGGLAPSARGNALSPDADEKGRGRGEVARQAP